MPHSKVFATLVGTLQSDLSPPTPSSRRIWFEVTSSIIANDTWCFTFSYSFYFMSSFVKGLYLAVSEKENSRIIIHDLNVFCHFSLSNFTSTRMMWKRLSASLAVEN